MASKLLHLQGLRALAIIFVVLFHFFPRFFPNGYLGVDQFFLLSGYLMTMMLERNPKFSIGTITDFFYRRVKRIVPLYYLATLIILVSISYTPVTTRKTNYDSARSALIFATNLIRPSGLESYNEKLGLGIDMFTHTWSLAVEMQFYFLFPVIFYGARLFRNRLKSAFVFIFAIGSLILHALADEFITFYCVFARIWQFMAGMIIFQESHREERLSSNCEQQEALIEKEDLEEKTETKELPLRQVVAYACLAATVALLSSREDIGHLAARIVTIIMTTLIVHVGERCWLLENRVMVLIGEISYGWYLVHWPIVALMKMHSLNRDDYMLASLSISLLISIVIYFLYEKHYRSWDWKMILVVTAGLLLLNAAALVNISSQLPNSETLDIYEPTENPHFSTNQSFYFYDSDYVNEMSSSYENKTNQERANLNDYMSNMDGFQVKDYPCTKINSPAVIDHRCLSTWNGTSSNMTLLVVGNSYVGNAMKTITKQCNDVFPRIYSSWTPTCTPLVHDKIITGGIDCSTDGFFFDAVRQFKPDVLMVVARYIDVNVIDNGTNPFNDRIWKEMVEKITELQRLVSKKIYILDTFEWPPNDLPVRLSKFLRDGTGFVEDEFFMPGNKPWYYVAKRRLARLVDGCEKCELFDYTNQFFVNGQLHYYDPKYFVSYFASSMHVNVVGQSRIAPLYRHICHKVQD